MISLSNATNWGKHLLPGLTRAFYRLKHRSGRAAGQAVVFGINNARSRLLAMPGCKVRERTCVKCSRLQHVSPSKHACVGSFPGCCCRVRLLAHKAALCHEQEGSTAFCGGMASS